LSKRRLSFLFTLFFLALAIPSAIISYIAYEKLRWETFHQYQQSAQSLGLEINNALNQAVIKEEIRSDTDYSFLIVEGDPNAKFLQRSILSRYPVESEFPGIIGYFQIDSNGVFSSPLMPKNSMQGNIYGLTSEDKLLRKQLAFNIHNILTQNQLVSNPSNVTSYKSTLISSDEEDKEEIAEGETKQQNKIMVTGSHLKRVADAKKDKLKGNVSFGFSQLESSDEQRKISQDVGRQQGYDIQLLGKKDKAFKLSEKKSNKPTLPKRSKRREQNYIPQRALTLQTEDFPNEHDNDKVLEVLSDRPVSINLFQSELEPFRFSLLKSGHFVAYRQVWRDGNRLIQGAILSVDEFFEQAIKMQFERSPLSTFTQLSITYGNNLLTSYPKQPMSYRSRNEPVNGELLSSTNLSEPFGQLSLVFHITQMPNGEGGQFILQIASLLVLALVFGTFALFRLTYRQSQLAQQHQDFISSVSHELKTPITSIKMYGEILKQGWVDEAKKEEYYDFIYSESERLSRLITNILQISKVSRNSLSLEIKAITVNELANVIDSKIDSQIKQSDFKYNLTVEPSIKNKKINIDTDAFIQIIINLVDNAIKYSSNSSQQQIDIAFSAFSNNKIAISVRDYGIGIAKSEADKVFELFYRIGNELTRESKGTGIGLALVKELTLAMNGDIKVVNRNKGAEFKLSFAELKN